jgi:hypothetical protein
LSDLIPSSNQPQKEQAGAEDHAVAVHELPEQIATLTHVRSLTARLFTRAEQAQNHCQVGNMGLAFRVIIDWMAGLGPIENLSATLQAALV